MKIQAFQYIAAIATLLLTLISDPEIAAWLRSHPLTTVSLLASPSFATLLRGLARLRNRPRALPDQDTKPINVGGG